MSLFKWKNPSSPNHPELNKERDNGGTFGKLEDPAVMNGEKDIVVSLEHSIGCVYSHLREQRDFAFALLVSCCFKPSLYSPTTTACWNITEPLETHGMQNN